MNGPYTITVTFGATVWNDVDHVKREAIRTCRRETKNLGVVTVNSPPRPPREERAIGEVRDADNELVRQVEAYRTASGTVKVRDLEI